MFLLGDCHVFLLVVFAHDRLTRLQMCPLIHVRKQAATVLVPFVGYRYWWNQLAAWFRGQIYNPVYQLYIRIYIYIAGYIISSTDVPNTRYIRWVDGKSVELMENPLSWWKILWVDGTSVELMEHPLSWWKIRWVDGKSLTKDLLSKKSVGNGLSLRIGPLEFHHRFDGLEQASHWWWSPKVDVLISIWWVASLRLVIVVWNEIPRCYRINMPFWTKKYCDFILARFIIWIWFVFGFIV